MSTTERISLNVAAAVALSAAFALAFVPAFASAQGNDSVVNDNVSNVTNTVDAHANSGDNTADGSYGGNGGRGGDIANSGDNVDKSRTGRGGNGGTSGEGGLIQTGEAVASSIVTTRANVNDTVIDRCACVDADNGDEENGSEDGHARVRNTNRATVNNGVDATADSGTNDAQGSYAGVGGRGGDLSNSGGDVDESNTGVGGTGGNSGAGGTVSTSRADALSDVLTVTNRNVSRIRR
jgi:hypothetical protein